jgi:hypothetical protein
MRINFKSASIPTRAAKRLKAQLGVKASLAQEWTAYTCGYRNWHELLGGLGKSSPSPLDEECTPEDLSARRQYQKSRLATCFKENEFSLDAQEVLMRWQPSAGHPQENPTRKTPYANWSKSEANMDFTAIVLLLLEGKRVEVDDLEDRLLAGIQDTANPRMLQAVVTYAGTAIKSPEPATQALARRLLEALSARSQHEATYNLAVSLMLGHGGPKDEKRGADLFQKLVDSTDEVSEVIRAGAKAGLGGNFLTGKGKPVRKNTANQLLEESALAGNAQAAFRIALDRDPDNIFMRGQVTADGPKSARFYRSAAKAGHLDAATGLGRLLVSYPELAEYPEEGREWLQKAADRGDSSAKSFLTKGVSRPQDINIDALPNDMMRAMQDMIIGMAMAGSPFKPKK